MIVLKRYSNIIIGILTALFMQSCKVQNLFETEQYTDIQLLERPGSDYQHRIQADDKISVSIWNHNDLSIGSVFNIYNSNEAFGKWILVDKTGYASMPKIGPVYLEGMTCKAAADSLIERYKGFLVDPVIVVKVLNRNVTILGEVTQPGNYLLEKERTVLTEIIGHAEGFTSEAELSKIQLIRDGRNFLLDLSSMNQSLHELTLFSGDVLVVPSKRGKPFHERSPTLIPFASFLTALALTFSVIK